jgi:hypothetical protein
VLLTVVDSATDNICLSTAVHPASFTEFICNRYTVADNVVLLGCESHTLYGAARVSDSACMLAFARLVGGPTL